MKTFCTPIVWCKIFCYLHDNYIAFKMVNFNLTPFILAPASEWTRDRMSGYTFFCALVLRIKKFRPHGLKRINRSEWRMNYNRLIRTNFSKESWIMAFSVKLGRLACQCHLRRKDPFSLSLSLSHLLFRSIHWSGPVIRAHNKWQFGRG